MARLIDETGNRYGRLLVLYRVENDNNRAKWHCKCDCGKECDVIGKSLRKGLTKSCGCLQKEKVKNINEKKITNQRFGRLIAIEPTKERKHGYVVWKCLCDCGNIHYVTTNNLSMGKVTSCGCMAHKSLGEEKIIKFLSQANIPFEREKIFDNCFYSASNSKCRFDFFVDNKYLIEYDGKQHYIKDKGYGKDLDLIQKRDFYKNNWCKENNIPLIRIPYTHYDSLCIEDLLLESSNFII